MKTKSSRRTKCLTGKNILSRLVYTHVAASSGPLGAWQRHFDAGGSTRLPDPQPVDHLEHFKNAVLAGAMPSPGSLLFMALALDDYFRAKGKKSLEQSFSIPARRGVGNAARAHAARNERAGQLWRMAFLRVEKPSMSVDEAASRVTGKDLKGHAILLKEYRAFGPWAERAIPAFDAENKHV